MDRQHSIDYISAAGIRAMWNSPRNQMPRTTVPGMSLAEILVAVALLAVISTGVLQFLTVTDTALFTIFGEDHLPSEAGNEWRKAVTPRQLGQPFRHTNFAFGTPSSNCFNNSALCEPHILPGYQHNLSLQTTVSGGDLWHSTHDLSAFCNGSDGQICGAYVEFGGLVSDPENVNLAVDIPVNVALQRDLCGVEP